jgi:hypothetical protein
MLSTPPCLSASACWWPSACAPVASQPCPKLNGKTSPHPQEASFGSFPIPSSYRLITISVMHDCMPNESMMPRRFPRRFWRSYCSDRIGPCPNSDSFHRRTDLQPPPLHALVHDVCNLCVCTVSNGTSIPQSSVEELTPICATCAIQLRYPVLVKGLQ